jgi:hypothetical protein
MAGAITIFGHCRECRGEGTRDFGCTNSSMEGGKGVLDSDVIDQVDSPDKRCA